jgi:hypothetical protein
MFQGSRKAIENTLALEVANYLATLNPEVLSKPGQSLSNLTSRVRAEIWPDLDRDEFSLTSEIAGIFQRMGELVRNTPEVAEFYRELTPEEQTAMTNKIIAKGELDKLPELSATGGYLAFAPLTAIVRLHSLFPRLWDENVLRINRTELLTQIGEEAASSVLARQHSALQHAFEICMEFQNLPSAAPEDVSLVQAAIDYISSKIL